MRSATLHANNLLLSRSLHRALAVLPKTQQQRNTALHIALGMQDFCIANDYERMHKQAELRLFEERERELAQNSHDAEGQSSNKNDIQSPQNPPEDDTNNNNDTEDSETSDNATAPLSLAIDTFGIRGLPPFMDEDLVWLPLDALLGFPSSLFSLPVSSTSISQSTSADLINTLPYLSFSALPTLILQLNRIFRKREHAKMAALQQKLSARLSKQKRKESNSTPYDVVRLQHQITSLQARVRKQDQTIDQLSNRQRRQEGEVLSVADGTFGPLCSSISAALDTSLSSTSHSSRKCLSTQT